MPSSGATKPPEQHSERLTSVAISIDSKHGSYRLLSGQRLEQFENDYFVPKARSVFGPVGEAALVSADNETELPPERFAPDDAKTFEIELACITPETTTEAERILRLFFDEEVAHSILDLGLREALVWWSPVETEVGAQLRALGAGTFDLRSAVDYHEGFCTQDLHVVVAPTWLVRLWGKRTHHGVTEVVELASLPGSRARIYHVTEVKGSGGPARLAQLIQDILRHHEWASSRLSTKIEEWESRFFRIYAADDVEQRGVEIPNLQAELARLRDFLSAIHLATLTMRRRAGNQAAFPNLVQKEAIDRSDKLEDGLRTQRGELRESFALVAGAVSEQQAQATRATEARIQGLTTLATYATALVLVPGLIIALYGADISGLPGKGQLQGLIWLAIGSIIGALVTMSILLGPAVRRVRVLRGLARAGDPLRSLFSRRSGGSSSA